MSNDNSDTCAEWMFHFGLCSNDEHGRIPRKKAEELLAVITAWAEENDYGIGGGFRPPDESDYRPFEVAPEDEGEKD